MQEHAIARVKKVNTYQLSVQRPDNKGFVYRLAYGYLHELKQYHKDPLTDYLKQLLQTFHCLNKRTSKTKLDEILKDKKIPKKILESLKVYNSLKNYLIISIFLTIASPIKIDNIKRCCFTVDLSKN